MPQSYTPDQVLKVLNSPDFTKASPEDQLQVRQELGLIVPRRKPEKPDVAESPSLTELLMGPAGIALPHIRKGAKDVQGMVDKYLETNEALENTGALSAEKGGVLRRAPAMMVKDIARLGGEMATPANVGMGIASVTPAGRFLTGAFMTGSGGLGLTKDLLSRDPSEPSADYLQRVLLNLSGIAGGVAGMKSGGLRNQFEQRVQRGTFASGGGAGSPGIDTALRMSLADIGETIKTRGMKINSLADVAKAVEATNERFNTYMGLAEQPFAGDKVMPTQAAQALTKAADEMAPSQAAEAQELRNEATKLMRKPMTLRELGKEVKHQNDLWRSHSGKTSLEASTAKTRASVAINDILRKSLRNTYIDYLESKYANNPGFRDIRLRQQQILNLREQLGTLNEATGAIEKGHVAKLSAAQAARGGAPLSEKAGATGVVSEHGARSYVRMGELFKKGPLTKADAAARKAFKDVPGNRMPTRSLKPLTPKTPPAGPQPAPGRAAVPPVPPSTPQTAQMLPVRGGGLLKKPTPQQLKAADIRSVTTYINGLEEQLKMARSARGSEGWVGRLENSIREARRLLEEKQKGVQ